MNKNTVAVIFFLSLFMSSTANAVEVVVNDGEWFNPTPGETYVFNGAFTNLKRILAWGFKLDTYETFDFVVTAPQEFDIYAVLTTALEDTDTYSTIYAGTTLTFSSSWLDFDQDMKPNWFAMWYSDNSVGLIIDDVYGGSLQMGNYVGPIPEPSSYLLMLSGLAMVGFVAKRRLNLVRS